MNSLSVAGKPSVNGRGFGGSNRTEPRAVRRKHNTTTTTTKSSWFRPPTRVGSNQHNGMGTSTAWLLFLLGWRGDVTNGYAYSSLRYVFYKTYPVAHSLLMCRLDIALDCLKVRNIGINNIGVNTSFFSLVYPSREPSFFFSSVDPSISE
jgi:hypothetical protein